MSTSITQHRGATLRLDAEPRLVRHRGETEFIGDFERPGETLTRGSEGVCHKQRHDAEIQEDGRL